MCALCVCVCAWEDVSGSYSMLYMLKCTYSHLLKHCSFVCMSCILLLYCSHSGVMEVTNGKPSQLIVLINNSANVTVAAT